MNNKLTTCTLHVMYISLKYTQQSCSTDNQCAIVHIMNLLS